MTRDEIIKKIMTFPNVPVIYDVDVENPWLKKENGHVKESGHLGLAIYHVFYDQERDRIIMSEY